MPRYEYKVVPAPTKGAKGKGVKGADARVAHALELLMNELGTEGWEYLRADTLPFEERTRLTRVETKYKNLLVFRRTIDGEVRTWPAVQSPDTTIAVTAPVTVPVGAPVAAAIVAPVTMPVSEPERPAVHLRSVETSKTSDDEADKNVDADAESKAADGKGSSKKGAAKKDGSQKDGAQKDGAQKD